jgi:hypothetical protein
VRAIVIVQPGGLQVFREGDAGPLYVSGIMKNIPDTRESWQSILDNLNEKPSAVQLKLLWTQPVPEALQYCLETFAPAPAALEIEQLEHCEARLPEDAESSIPAHFSEAFDAMSVVAALQRDNTFLSNRFKKMQAVLGRREAGK